MNWKYAIRVNGEQINLPFERYSYGTGDSRYTLKIRYIDRKFEEFKIQDNPSLLKDLCGERVSEFWIYCDSPVLQKVKSLITKQDDFYLVRNLGGGLYEEERCSFIGYQFEDNLATQIHDVENGL